MVRRSSLLVVLSAAGMLLAADDTWKSVQALKSRTELRIFRKSAREPLNAALEEADENRIVVVAKDKQLAIPKEDVDRIDGRPVKAPAKHVDSTAKVTDPDFVRPHPPNGGANVPTTSYGSNVSFGKPDFETVYRRPLVTPKTEPKP